MNRQKQRRNAWQGRIENARRAGMVFVLAAGGVCVAPSAFARKPDPAPARDVVAADRAAVEARLGAYDRVPSASELRALGPHVDAVLVAIARDEAVAVPVRLRATSALAYAPSPTSRNYLIETVARFSAASAPSDLLFVRKAALALAWQGGATVPDKLAPLLDHADPAVRIDGAVALALTRQMRARDLLDKRMRVEKDPAVQKQIARQLETLDKALGADKDKNAAPAIKPRVVNPPPSGTAEPRSRLTAPF